MVSRERQRETLKRERQTDRQTEKLAEDQPPFNKAFDVKQSVTDTFLMSRKNHRIFNVCWISASTWQRGASLQMK